MHLHLQPHLAATEDAIHIINPLPTAIEVLLMPIEGVDTLLLLATTLQTALTEDQHPIQATEVVVGDLITMLNSTSRLIL